MKFISVSKKVETYIQTLNKSGKAGTTLANKAKCIIESLALGTAQYPIKAVGSFTKYGEKRIRNCRKYDLGCGYRLITLQRGKTVFIAFLGTHDECQCWLENNKRRKNITVGKGTIFPVSEKDSTACDSSNDPHEDFYEDEIPMDLNEQDLRNVFSGLVEGAKKKSQ